MSLGIEIGFDVDHCFYFKWYAELLEVILNDIELGSFLNYPTRFRLVAMKTQQ